VKNLKIGARLGLAFAVVLALLLAMAATSLTRMQTAGDLTYRLVNTSTKNQQTVSEWRKAVEVNDALIDAVYHAGDVGVVAQLAPRLRDNVRRAEALQADVDANLLNMKVRVFLDRAKELRGAYDGARDAVLEAKLSGDPARLEQAYNAQFVPRARAFEAALEEFANRQSTATGAVGTTILTSYAETRIILLVLAVAAIILGAGFAWFITRSITAPLRQAVEVAERVADGDLGSRVDAQGRDEVAQLMEALGRMNANLAARRSRRRPAKSRAATRTCRAAPSSRPVRSRKPRPRWRNSPPPCARTPNTRAAPMAWPPAPPASPAKAARWSTRWSAPWAASTRRRSASSTSSA